MKCQYPLWGWDEKSTDKYCNESVFKRSYCKKHFKACYVKIPVKSLNHIPGNQKKSFGSV